MGITVYRFHPRNMKSFPLRDTTKKDILFAEQTLAADLLSILLLVFYLYPFNCNLTVPGINFDPNTFSIAFCSSNQR